MMYERCCLKRSDCKKELRYLRGTLLGAEMFIFQGREAHRKSDAVIISRLSQTHSSAALSALGKLGNASYSFKRNVSAFHKAISSTQRNLFVVASYSYVMTLALFIRACLRPIVVLIFSALGCSNKMAI